MKTIYFSKDFIDLVKSKIIELCSDGTCISYNQLIKACNLKVSNILVIRELIRLELKGSQDGEVEIVSGKLGGIGLVGKQHPLSKKRSKKILDQDFVELVKIKLEEILKTKQDRVSANILAGLLNISNVSRVRKVITLLSEFKMIKGVGIKRQIK